ncbi:MAG TPA: fused MFS/spermidine synthase [Gemmatimonadales bacterium]|nr:fused MFS/spermidine synthase [Gemmatimonadales bacterium]
MRSRQVQAYTLLFFLSGATGLVYELLWVRLLYQSFGSTIQSVTTVVAAYMGGLGLGAYLLGARGDRHPRPAALYGRLEILIGCFGLVSPLVLSLAQHTYIALARGLPEGSAVSVALRFGLAGLVLLIPTTLMGGTLPVLTRAFTATDRGLLRISLGRLYGINTLGAVLGTALAGFVLIEHVGIRASLIATAAVNIAIGIIALRLPSPGGSPDPGRQSGTPEEQSPAQAVPLLLRRLALVLLAATAFVSLLDEIAWTRVLVMVVGGSTYAFTLVLLCFLLGIGLGSALVARRSETPSDAVASTVLAQGVTAAGAALIIAFFSALPAYVLRVFQIPGLNAGPRLGLLGGAVAAVVLIPAVGMGMTFPLLTDLIASTGEARGADVGRAYLLNTSGSILGAVLTGFVLVTTLGSDTTLRLGVAVNVLAALALAVAVSRGVVEGSALQRRLQSRVIGGAILATAGLVAVVAAPGRGLRTIDLGPTIYGREKMTAAERRGFLTHMGARPLRLIEGRNSTVSVWESPVGRALKVNGKVDASDYGDMDTQIMLGLAPVVAHPHPHQALAIGFGSGVTTAVLAAVPGMNRVRVVELEPAVLELAPYFRSVNQDVLTRPTVRAIADDARSALQLTNDQFDVIVSEPSNPWVAGVATLYTPDFYRIVRGRLARGGVFCQWVQLYQLPLAVVAGIVRNVHEVFPHVSVWSAGNYDLMVLGSAEPLVSDTAWVETLLGRGGALAVPGHEFLMLDAPQQYFDRQVLGEAGVSRLVRHATLAHTDDRPELEYVAARRFLDSREMGDILDSLAAIERPVEAEDHLPADRLARALSARLGDLAASGFVEAAHRSAPQDPRWIVPLAGLAIASGDTARADSLLATLRTPDARALLLSGLIATARDEPLRARPLLERALAAGGDTTRALAALAVLDAEDTLWSAALREAWGVLAATRNTFRSALPRDLLAPALEGLALEAPAAAADSLLRAAIALRPGWPKLYELRAAVLLREKRCDDAVGQFLTLEDFGLEREDGPELVERCRRGRT